ncbi:purine-nucleoside phosphorylase [Leucobacter sp. M11]|uniref:purine-nucleoside phosphorylase n=1 Tax=Leucobacter sp. M11 TaxID=2993565 RepID=UPI002D8053A9|nr:purine-nucleoside phosphorylase [Leucobacter sp. M11]MEB4615323.1 purine-nucleoside phosphorylase [Leucobacter sp. M11]
MSTAETRTPSELARAAADAIAELSGVERHDIALTLGSGWGKAAGLIGETVAEVPADRVPGFRQSAVVGHPGTLTSIRIPNGKHALVIGSRTHLYEGHGVRAVVHGVRAAAAAGCETMVLTNGAGGLKPGMVAGEPMLISDHLNLTAVSPVEGANFVDLTDLYAERLRAIVREVSPGIEEGVYTQLPGPHYETPAEIGYLQTIGGHAVGMSTALEAIAAREAGMAVLGLSLITNLAAGIQETPLNHAEVIEAGRQAEARLGALLGEVVGRL